MFRLLEAATLPYSASRVIGRWFRAMSVLTVMSFNTAIGIRAISELDGELGSRGDRVVDPVDGHGKSRANLSSSPRERVTDKNRQKMKNDFILTDCGLNVWNPIYIRYHRQTLPGSSSKG